MAKTIERETASNGAAVVNRNIHAASITMAKLEQEASVSVEAIGFDRDMAAMLQAEDQLLEASMERLIAIIQHREDALQRMKQMCSAHAARNYRRNGYC